MNCTCDAYPSFPHRPGGGARIECGCPEAPRCEHWAPDVDPHGTGDNDRILYERIDR